MERNLGRNLKVKEGNTLSKLDLDREIIDNPVSKYRKIIKKSCQNLKKQNYMLI